MTANAPRNRDDVNAALHPLGFTKPMRPSAATRLLDHLLQRGIRLRPEFHRAMVVQPRLCPIGRLLRRKYDGEIEVRIRIARIEFDCQFQFLLRLLLPTLLTPSDAQLVVSRRVLRVDHQRLGQLIHRLIIPLLAVIDDPQRAMHEAVARRDLDSLLERRFRALEFLSAEIDHSKIRQRVETVRSFREHLLLKALGLTVVALVKLILALVRLFCEFRRQIYRVADLVRNIRVSRHLRVLRSGSRC